MKKSKKYDQKNEKGWEREGEWKKYRDVSKVISMMQPFAAKKDLRSP